MCLAAGHATESFTDFVVGHGELWSAQMLSAVVRKVQWLLSHYLKCLLNHNVTFPVILFTIVVWCL